MPLNACPVWFLPTQVMQLTGDGRDHHYKAAQSGASHSFIQPLTTSQRAKAPDNGGNDTAWDQWARQGGGDSVRSAGTCDIWNTTPRFLFACRVSWSDPLWWKWNSALLINANALWPAILFVQRASGQEALQFSFLPLGPRHWGITGVVRWTGEEGKGGGGITVGV